MLIISIALVVAALSAVVYVLSVALRQRRRKRLMHQPFPPEWQNILENNVALYRYLPNQLREQLHKDINVFLAEKEFEGCGGLSVTDEMKVTIAAEACLLLLNRKPSFFPNLHSILIYPHPYDAPAYQHVGGGNYAEDVHTRAGESWTGGDLVLAWDSVRAGSRNGRDGHNVVLHEFAHQLDQLDGSADGAPPLELPSRYRQWARILNYEYQRLRSDLDHNRTPDLDPYGATNPAEFFAVATESFFEKPRQMQKNQPELYAELKDYYKLDPGTWAS